MDAQAWIHWLRQCNFNFATGNQQFVAVKNGYNMTLCSFLGVHSHFDILETISAAIRGDSPLEILIKEFNFNRQAQPYNGLISFLEGPLRLKPTITTLSDHEAQILRSQTFHSTRNVTNVSRIVATTKPNYPHMLTQINLSSENQNFKLQRLYKAAAFSLFSSDIAVAPPDSPYDYAIAAILVANNGEILSFGLNKAGTSRLHHAEICALKSYLDNHAKTDLPNDCHLYTTLKPCHMCAGFLSHYAQRTQGLHIYYGHTDHNALVTALESSTATINKLDNTGKPLRIKSHTPQILNTNQYLDTTISRNYTQSLKGYSAFFKEITQVLLTKEKKYDSAPEIKPVAAVLAQIHKFMKTIGHSNFTNEWWPAIEISDDEINSDMEEDEVTFIYAYNPQTNTITID